jgi:hypothetical protein
VKRFSACGVFGIGGLTAQLQPAPMKGFAMAKKKAEAPKALTPAPLDEIGAVRSIMPDEEVLDDLELELMSACANWVEDHKLSSAFFTYIDTVLDDEDDPISMYAYLRAQVEDLRRRVDEAVAGCCCYVVTGGAQ